MSAVEDWCRSAAKALDAKPWLHAEYDAAHGPAFFTCLFCNSVDSDGTTGNHEARCRMRALEDLSRTIPKELLE